MYETLTCHRSIIPGLLTSDGKAYRQALVIKEPLKFVEKLSVNLRHISSSEF
jgi:hypothetical protein